MTVKELIAALQKAPEDMLVAVRASDEETSIIAGVHSAGPEHGCCDEDEDEPHGGAIFIIDACDDEDEERNPYAEMN